MRKRLTVGAIVVLVLLSSLGVWLARRMTAAYYGGPGTESFVEIPRGAGSGEIADALKTGGALRYKLPFLLYIRWTGMARRLQAGEYRFSAPARPFEVARRLAQGDVFFRAITIPEGLTARETIALLARSGFGTEPEMNAFLLRTDWIADLDPGATSLEGYLFPETYRFPRLAASETILKAMVSRFRVRIERLLAAAPTAAGTTLAHIVTLASMIEKEARTAEERRLVASVLTNRLQKKMALACDPTIIYALKQAGGFDGNLRKRDLSLPSPYNTYLHSGLPPGPIANPGADALEAALSPARSDYFYYVSRNDGTHVFSKDLQSHLLAVDRFQRHGARSGSRCPKP